MFSRRRRADRRMAARDQRGPAIAIQVRRPSEHDQVGPLRRQATVKAPRRDS